MQNLADSVETALDTYETFTSWTPSWDTSAGGGFTSVGAGTNEGFYMRIGKFVHAEFRVELGAGFATDSGTFTLILPIAAYVWGGSTLQGTIGTWTARNNSDPFHWSGSLGLFTAAATSVSFGGSYDGTASRSRIDSNDPIVWANNDVLSGVLDYRGV